VEGEQRHEVVGGRHQHAVAGDRQGLRHLQQDVISGERVERPVRVNGGDVDHARHLDPLGHGDGVVKGRGVQVQQGRAAVIDLAEDQVKMPRLEGAEVLVDEHEGVLLALLRVQHLHYNPVVDVALLREVYISHHQHGEHAVGHVHVGAPEAVDVAERARGSIPGEHRRVVRQGSGIKSRAGILHGRVVAGIIGVAGAHVLEQSDGGVEALRVLQELRHGRPHADTQPENQREREEQQREERCFAFYPEDGEQTVAQDHGGV